MSYEQWDAIADAYTPLLGIILLVMLARYILTKRYGLAKQLSLATLIAVSCVYGLMAIDNQLMIWPSLALDYSTHTALSLALVLMLIKTSVHTGMKMGLAASMVAYAILMVYQEYHTVVDILSTALVIGVAVFCTNRLIWKPTAPR